MLEIALLIVLTRKIGEICRGKGRAATGLKILTVVLWFGFEFLGGLIGAIATAGEENVIIYICALLGAVVGATIAFLIAKNLAPINQPPSPHIPPYA